MHAQKGAATAAAATTTSTKINRKYFKWGKSIFGWLLLFFFFLCCAWFFCCVFILTVNKESKSVFSISFYGCLCGKETPHTMMTTMKEKNMSTRIKIHIYKVRLGMREILEKKITTTEMSRTERERNGKKQHSARRKICDHKRENCQNKAKVANL